MGDPPGNGAYAVTRAPPQAAQLAIAGMRLVRLLSLIAVALVVLSALGQISRHLLGHGQLKGLVALFFLDEEANVPTFFSVLLLLLAAALLAGIGVLERTQRAPHVTKWSALALLFLLAAYDEAFEAHERLIAPVTALLGGGRLGVLYYAWVLPGALLVAALGIYFLRFLVQLEPGARARFLGAAFVYLAGAIGVEMLGGWYVELHGYDNLRYALIVTLEESLELAGLILFVRALILYCAQRHPQIALSICAH